MTTKTWATLNVVGLNNIIKHKRIEKCIRELKVDTIYLQETRIRAREKKYLEKRL